MKNKILTILTIIGSYLFIALPARAQSIDPCPKGAGGGFFKLCNLNKDTLATMVQNGITILFIVATVASLVFLVLGGIKWITSGGDKANLEQARNWIVAAAVGLIITFASYFILNFILELFGLNSINTYTIPNLVS